MSTLEKLQIQGVRSFSPDPPVAIQFYKPLTLIVGPNGAGKTTIIECLKQVCTGSFPPNTKGASFIHDPKIAGDTEVKAKIKLQFIRPGGKPVIVSRSFSATQKRGSVSFSTIDTTIQTLDDQDQVVTVPSRCVEIDRLVSELMSVPRSVLENVIFVHQEDALWPLTEASQVKKKFDDIFESTRYSKALEEIQKLRKKKQQEVKDSTAELRNLKTNLDYASQVRRGIEESERAISVLNHEIDDMKTKLNESELSAQGLKAQIDEINAIEAKMGQLSAQLDIIVRSKQDMYSSLSEVIHQSVDEIEALTAEIDHLIATHEETERQLKREVREGEITIESLRDERTKKSQIQGGLETEIERMKRDVADRNALLQRLNFELQLGKQLYQDPLSQEDVDRVTAAISGKLEELNDELSDIVEEGKKKSREIQREVDHVNEKLNASTETCRIYNSQLPSKKKRMQELVEEHQKAGEEERRAKPLRAEKAEAVEKLEELKAEAANPGLRDKELETRAALKTIDEELHRLYDERTQLSKQSDTLFKIDYLEAEALKKRNRAGAILDSVLDSLSNHADGTHIERSAKGGLEVANTLLTEAEQSLKDRTSEERKVQEKVSLLIQTTEQYKERLETLRSDGEKRLQEVQDVLGSRADPSSLAEKIEALEKEKAAEEKEPRTRGELGCRAEQLRIGAATKEVYSAFLKHVDDNNSCPVCSRGFCDGSSSRQVRSSIMQKINRGPSSSQKSKARIEELGARLGELRQLLPVWSRAQEDMEAMKSLEDKLDESRQSLVEAEEAEQGYMLEKSFVEDKVQSLKEVVKELETAVDLEEAAERDVRESTSLREQLAQNEEQGRSLEQVRREIETFENDKQAHYSQLSDLNQERQRLQASVTQQQETVTRISEQLITAEQLAMRKVQCAEELEWPKQELRSEVEAMETQITQEQRNEAEYKSQKQKAMMARDAQIAENDRKEREVKKRIDHINFEMSTLNDRNAGIRRAQDRNREEHLQKIKEEIRDLSERQSHKERKLAEKKKKITDLQETMMSRDKVRRGLRDNLEFRRKEEEEMKMKEELEALRRTIEQIGVKSNIMNEYRKANDAIVALNADINTRKGRVETSKGHLESLQSQLKKPIYNNIDKRYSKLKLQVTTMEMVNRDLEKYQSALEKALISFHSTKMEEINKTIKELWQEIYCNEDIDYIYIQSEANESKNTRRNYDYRVVMHTFAGADIDMRGRCSAGQKVLACLIIRLALAETFCVNCGILALDEPTTNLDEKNSESLAKALVRLMEARKKNKSFQLIVITHDEKFARLIGVREHAEFYWRISKNENQNSQMKRQTIL